MKISVVTPSFNQAEFIEATIRSVKNQQRSEVEHIVIDGGSTDGTVDILRKYPDLNWVSERDSGQSNAINKGFRKATGEVMAWLNSDDCYAVNALSRVGDYFATHPECMVLYGDITFMDRSGQPLFVIAGEGIDEQRLVACPDVIRQPSTFWRREVVTELGGVDERLHLVMDFDFFLRAARRFSFHYLPENLSYYRLYPQNKSLSSARRQVAEIFSVYRKNHVAITPRIAKFLLGKYARSYAGFNALERLVRPSKRTTT